jgi:hypothetical protein
MTQTSIKSLVFVQAAFPGTATPAQLTFPSKEPDASTQ